MIWLLSMGPARLVGAAMSIALFATLCAVTWWREQRRVSAHQAAQGMLPGGDSTPAILVVHASQTGTAEELAWQSAQSLQTAGLASQVLPLGAVTLELLQQARRALFIVSTYGEGDPPDAAAPFVRATMLQPALARTLDNLHCAVLALGDSTYAHYCGFGRTLEQWLQERGANSLFQRIEADRVADTAIDAWRGQLAQLGGGNSTPPWPDAFTSWTLQARKQLNPGSEGEPVCHLELLPADDASLPHWEAGDLLQVRVPGETLPRDYSIASIPQDGSLQLLVRQARRADGSMGAASGWLLSGAALGERIEARIRVHRGFRLEQNAARPLLLIGNGTGIAGLRALLRTRAAQPESSADARCWLIFGERSARHDALYAEELLQWQRSGMLQRCDLVYSRDGNAIRYVQQHLSTCGDAIRAWIDAGAAIYVCGSLQGMASGVDAALEQALGRDGLDQLIVAGRYRRDVY